MPNHCNNTLTVNGSSPRIRDFARDHYRVPDSWANSVCSPPSSPSTREHKTTLDFSYAVPYPPLHERVDLSQGWYDWHVDNWGTKWNAYDITPLTFPEILDEIEQGESLTYSFDTAWAPPMGWLETMSPKYPNLTFTLTYEEPGMCFAGYCKSKDGKILAEEHLSDYHDALLSPEEQKLLESDEEDGWEILRAKLDKFFQEIPD